MLSAHNSHGYILASYATKEDGPFYCPECHDAVLLKKGSVKIHHFAHIPPTNCIYGSGESETHRQAKMEIYEALQKHPEVSKLQIERSLKDVRPDVSFCLRNRHYVAIEVQLSTLSPYAIEVRTKAYADKGIHVLWTPPFLSSLPLEKYRYSPKLWEKYLHSMYFGKIYYWMSDEILRPVRFAEHQMYIEERSWFDGYDECSAGGYYKRSKRYRSVRYGDSVTITGLQPVFRKAWESKTMSIPAAKLWCEPFRKEVSA